MLVSRAPKFCARRWSQIQKMSYQNPINRGKLVIIEPWPECQPEFSEWDPRSQGYPHCPRTQIEARSPLTAKVARVPLQISNAPWYVPLLYVAKYDFRILYF